MNTDRSVYGLSDTIAVSVVIENTGDRSVNELVAVFSQDQVASITPSVNRLRHFQRTELGSGDSATISARIAVADLGFINRENEYAIEPGKFGLKVAGEVVEIEVKLEQ